MSLADRLAELLPPGASLAFGELRLSCDAAGRYHARHREDADPDAGAGEGLVLLDSPGELRDWAKYDAEGVYRPLRTAPGLKRGWRTETERSDEFLKRLDALYPGAFAAWCGYEAGTAAPVALRSTLDRQTGMYRFAGTIGDEDARRLVEDLCHGGCLRKVAWSVGAEDAPAAIEAAPEEIPLICLEACTFAVNKARELAKEAFERSQSAAS